MTSLWNVTIQLEHALLPDSEESLQGDLCGNGSFYTVSRLTNWWHPVCLDASKTKTSRDHSLRSWCCIIAASQIFGVCGQASSWHIALLCRRIVFDARIFFCFINTWPVPSTVSAFWSWCLRYREKGWTVTRCIVNGMWKKPYLSCDILFCRSTNDKGKCE